jgi:hypothetical protein
MSAGGEDHGVPRVSVEIGTGASQAIETEFEERRRLGARLEGRAADQAAHEADPWIAAGRPERRASRRVEFFAGHPHPATPAAVAQAGAAQGLGRGRPQMLQPNADRSPPEVRTIPV